MATISTQTCSRKRVVKHARRYIGGVIPWRDGRSVRDDGGVQALGHHVAVRQAVVLHGARGEALERGVPQRVHDRGQALLRTLEDVVGSVAFVVHRVDVCPVRE